MSLSEETKRKISEKCKGRKFNNALDIWKANGGVPWNKGLTMKDDERIRRYTEKRNESLRIGKYSPPMLGKKHTEETKEKMSINNGRYWKGKKLSEETKRKMSEANKGRRLSEEERRKLSERRKGKRLSDETKKKISESVKAFYKDNEEERRKKSEFFKGRTAWNKGLTVNNDERVRNYTEKRKKSLISGECKPSMLGKKHTDEWKKYMSNLMRANPPNKGKKHSEEWKKNMSEQQKELWKNPEFKEKSIKRMLKGLLKRPTSLEQRFIRIIRKHNLPYRYVGNGDFIIGGKNPDFVNVNGVKKCIEIRPRKTVLFWNGCSPEEYELRRKEHFSKYGWDCQVIWYEDFNEKSLNERLLVAMED